jgi:hypothetical protein
MGESRQIEGSREEKNKKRVVGSRLIRCHKERSDQVV